MLKYNTEIKLIDINRVKPNSWNSNQLTEKEFEKLVDDIATNGFYGAIIVRPVGNNLFEIIDGEHRWRALKKLNASKVPCIVKLEKEAKAKISSIRLNTERGQQNQKKLAEIIKSLQEKNKFTLKEIERELIYDIPELQDKLALLELPNNLEQIIKEKREQELEDLPILYTFFVRQKDSELVDKVLSKFSGSKSEVLLKICQKIIQE